MNETVRNKMRKRCEWIWNISNFFYYMNIIALIILVLFGVCAFFQSPNQFTVDFEPGTNLARSVSMQLFFDYSSGAFSLPIDCNLIQDAAVHAKSIYLLVIGLVGFSALPTIFIAWKLRTIFDSLDNEETPFTRKNCKSLAHISYTLILLGLLSDMFANIMLVIFEFSRHVKIAFSFEYIFLGCIVLALSHFFEYGVVLQQESDELL